MGGEVTTIIVAVITAIVGPIAVFYITKRKYEDKNANTDDVAGTGIQITSIREGDAVGEYSIISGRYKNKPSKSRLQLYVYWPEGEKGYYPQGIATYDNNPEKTWRAECNLGGHPGAKVTIVAAMVGPDGQALFDYYRKVGERLHHWTSIDSLTSDIVSVDSVKVTRK